MSRKIHIPKSAIFILVLLSLAYIVWEVYWCTKVGLYFVRWHTHLAICLALWTAGYFFFKKLLKIKKPAVYSIFHSCMFFLFFLEGMLIITGLTKTYSEKQYGIYQSHYDHHQSTESYYHTWYPGDKTHVIEKEEYQYIFPTNSLGFADNEWEIPSPGDSSIRILALGDSFTEGDGGPYDSSYVYLLRKKLHKTGKSYYVMNAGICGSDPFFNYINLRDRLLKYKPQVILQTLSSLDVTSDIAIRGGMERFLPQQQIYFKKKPWWEPIYAVNYTIRILFKLQGYTEELVRPIQRKKELNKLIIDLFKEYTQLCREHHITLIVLLKPEREEVKKGQHTFDFSDFIAYMNQQPHTYIFDFIPYYQNRLATTKTSIKQYYWVKDAHHNSKGYDLMSDAVFDFLQQIPPDSLVYK